MFDKCKYIEIGWHIILQLILASLERRQSSKHTQWQLYTGDAQSCVTENDHQWYGGWEKGGDLEKMDKEDVFESVAGWGESQANDGGKEHSDTGNSLFKGPAVE